MDENLGDQQPQNITTQVCPFCHIALPSDSYFCPNCGKQRKQKPLSITFGKQLVIYLISIFLPPFGLWPAIKYLQQKDQKARIVGLVAIILTIISIVATLYIYKLFIDQFYNSMNTQLD